METKPDHKTTAITATRQVSVNSWNLVRSVAKGCNITPLQVLTAYEYGIPLSAARKAVYMMPNGINTLAPKVVWGKVITHPEFKGYAEKRLVTSGNTFEGWELTLKRTNGISATRSFTMTEARRITQGPKKLAEKDVYKNYPERMCFWRAMSAVQDVVFPDVTFGIYKSDELGAEITPDGEIIDAESWDELPPLPKRQAPTHQELIDRFDPVLGPEACIKAGVYNATTEEQLFQVEDKLAVMAAKKESENEATDIV